MNNKSILFLSTSDAVSVMAAGWASKLKEPSLEFISASFTKTASTKFSIQAMKEVNIDITEKKPELLAPHLLKKADLIINIFDFEHDQLPSLLLASNKKTLSWNIPNPDHCKNAVEKWAAYQVVCDELACHVKKLTQELT